MTRSDIFRSSIPMILGCILLLAMAILLAPLPARSQPTSQPRDVCFTRSEALQIRVAQERCKTNLKEADARLEAVIAAYEKDAEYLRKVARRKCGTAPYVVALLLGIGLAATTTALIIVVVRK